MWTDIYINAFLSFAVAYNVTHSLINNEFSELLRQSHASWTMVKNLVQVKFFVSVFVYFLTSARMILGFTHLYNPGSISLNSSNRAETFNAATENRDTLPSFQMTGARNAQIKGLPSMSINITQAGISLRHLSQSDKRRPQQLFQTRQECILSSTIWTVFLEPIHPMFTLTKAWYARQFRLGVAAAVKAFAVSKRLDRWRIKHNSETRRKSKKIESAITDSNFTRFYNYAGPRTCIARYQYKIL